jgi:ankyrin repeat protein
MAAYNGHYECISTLIAEGANVNIAMEVNYDVTVGMYEYNFGLFYHLDEQDGETALMMATRKRHDECVSILIANGADINMAMEVVALCFFVCVPLTSHVSTPPL